MISSRPKLGFIVEGHNEYNFYPSIITKILGYYPSDYKIVNANGIGNIIKHLDDSLLALVKTVSPEKIIVTIDLKDCIDQKFVTNCRELKDLITCSASKWLQTQKEQGSLNDKLPEEIIVVIVDKCFETWLIADIEGLKNCEYFDKYMLEENFSNVDDEVISPASWLKSRSLIVGNLKSIKIVRSIVSKIDPNIGKNYSRSLRKFYKEVSLNSRNYSEN